MMQKIKQQIYDVIETTPPINPAGRIFNYFIVTLISLNVAAVILETVQSLSLRYDTLFKTFELVSVLIFTVEYILRLLICTNNPDYRRPVLGRLRYALTFMALVDLTAILPFYLPMVMALDLRIVRAIRLLRLFRIFKLGRYSESMKTLIRVLKAKKEELYITAFVVLILLITASSLMYYVEHGPQPEVFSSIPAAMWWGVATLTTVGYGDIFPVTTLGKIMGSFIAFLGIGLFALPAGILGSGFVEEMNRKKADIKKTCPHCGKEI